MTDELEDRIKATLAAKAASVRPSAGEAGLDAIQRKLASSPASAPVRRSRGPWLVAAAAAVVVAVVGGTLVNGGDAERDQSVVAAGPDGGTTTGEALLDAVWPTDSPSALAAMEDDALDDPAAAAAAYLADRLERPLTVDDVELEGSLATIRDDGNSPTVELGSVDGRWYVRRATSELISVELELVRDALHGAVVPAAGGDLTVLVDEEQVHRGFADADVPVVIDHDTDGRAVVRATLVGDAGNATLDERLFAGGFTAHPTLDAVWPTDDPEVLRGISASWARDISVVPAVRLYLQDRLGKAPEDADLTVFEPHDPETEVTTVAVAGGAGVEIELRKLDGEIWYVQRATSELLDVGATFDGERVGGGVVPGADGVLEISYSTGDGGGGGTTQGRAGERIPLDYQMPPSASFVLRVLQPTTGALHEQRLLAPPGAPAAPPDAPEPPSLGVWPKPVDEIAGEDLENPVDAARLYLMATADLDEGVQLSDYREGDSNSGEVEVTGDVNATIALRRVEGRWHVEAVHTPLVDALADVPGELWLHANVEGDLSVTVLDAWGTVVQSMPSRRMVEGEEVVVVPAEPVHKPFTVRYRFEPTVGNPMGIGDVAVPGTASSVGSAEGPEVHEVPDEAIYAGGGLDPIGTAQAYVEARLGFWPDGMVLDVGSSDEDSATVSWPYGSVFLVRHDGYWYVTESIGASVSFESIDLPTVQVFLGEPGVLEVQLLDAEGGACASASTEVDGRGPATVTFEDVPCDVESVVATMNEVIAEQAPSR